VFVPTNCYYSSYDGTLLTECNKKVPPEAGLFLKEEVLIY
jgi:hypothetical protein